MSDPDDTVPPLANEHLIALPGSWGDSSPWAEPGLAFSTSGRTGVGSYSSAPQVAIGGGELVGDQGSGGSDTQASSFGTSSSGSKWPAAGASENSANAAAAAATAAAAAAPGQAGTQLARSGIPGPTPPAVIRRPILSPANLIRLTPDESTERAKWMNKGRAPEIIDHVIAQHSQAQQPSPSTLNDLVGETYATGDEAHASAIPYLQSLGCEEEPNRVLFVTNDDLLVREVLLEGANLSRRFISSFREMHVFGADSIFDADVRRTDWAGTGQSALTSFSLEYTKPRFGQPLGEVKFAPGGPPISSGDFAVMLSNPNLFANRPMLLQLLRHPNLVRLDIHVPRLIGSIIRGVVYENILSATTVSTDDRIKTRVAHFGQMGGWDFPFYPLAPNKIRYSLSIKYNVVSPLFGFTVCLLRILGALTAPITCLRPQHPLPLPRGIPTTAGSCRVDYARDLRAVIFGERNGPGEGETEGDEEEVEELEGSDNES